MKNILSIFFCIGLISLMGCKRDFEEINTNPNAPINVQPELLLRQVIYDYGEEMSYEGFVAGNLLGQYFTMIDFNLFDRHSLGDPQFGGNPWPVLYTNLRDNEILLELSRSNASYAVYEGPALVMKSYIAMALTDIYGDVPYYEALQGKDGIVTPAYNGQADIYVSPGGILANLEAAISAMEGYNGSFTLDGDILFGGNLTGWITFARSLLIKAYMRISDVFPSQDYLPDLFNTGDYMQANAQNATFNFTGSQPNNFRMANLRSGDFNLFIMSETMEEILEGLNDPRQQVFFRPIGNDPSGTTYTGLLNGPDASQTSISVADYSLSGTIFRENTALLDANFLTAWEVEFLLAEAAEKGLITSNAQAHYENGVALAFEYWNTPLPADYLTTGDAAWGAAGSTNLQKILTQKWIANIINGYEGWIEYRRTGVPALKIVSASLNNDLIPTRLPYPTDEAALNAENYYWATFLNDNSVNARVWWDAF